MKKVGAQKDTISERNITAEEEMIESENSVKDGSYLGGKSKSSHIQGYDGIDEPLASETVTLSVRPTENDGFKVNAADGGPRTI